MTGPDRGLLEYLINVSGHYILPVQMPNANSPIQDLKYPVFAAERAPLGNNGEHHRPVPEAAFWLWR